MTATTYEFLTGVCICAGLAASGIVCLGAFGWIYVKPMKLFTVSREELWKKAVR